MTPPPGRNDRLAIGSSANRSGGGVSRRRVVITGMGAVTPLGGSVGDTWAGLKEGRSGVGPITLFDASSFLTRIAGEVKAPLESGADARFLGRHSVFAIQAAREAAEDSGFARTANPARVGVYFGAGDGGFDFKEYAAILQDSADESGGIDSRRYCAHTLERVHPRSVVEQDPSEVVNHLARHFGALGPVSNCLTACAASSQAIGEAAEIIRGGQADVMVTGGAHSMVHPLGVTGFILLTALSTRNDEPARASRPFDKARDGFVLSEGAGVLILEELEHAMKRGARIYAELTGYGCSADAFRLTDPHPEGRGAIQAMRHCLADAGASRADVDYINAHGTSTQLNDQIETYSVKKVFGDAAARIPMSSIKSMLGHMIAAAGAVEIIASVLTIREGVIPPTINYETPDPHCDLDYVPNFARKARVKRVLSNSFGFGGQNVSLIVDEFK